MDSWTEESHAGDDLGFEFETLKLIGFLLCLAIGTIVAVTYQCLAVADQRRMRNNNNTQQQQNEQQPRGLQIN
ncbi:TOXICOS EN LEVADURA 2 [Prunus dulcis]|nr:TOXICOS EN LEVADURA 2 [Prunus dulcis]